MKFESEIIKESITKGLLKESERDLNSAIGILEQMNDIVKKIVGRFDKTVQDVNRGKYGETEPSFAEGFLKSIKVELNKELDKGIDWAKTSNQNKK